MPWWDSKESKVVAGDGSITYRVFSILFPHNITKILTSFHLLLSALRFPCIKQGPQGLLPQPPSQPPASTLTLSIICPLSTQ